jgi:hypothetical protein
LLLLSLILGHLRPPASAGENAARERSGATDYLEPKVLTGTIYADDSMSKVLFKFRRSATNVGSTVQVAREYKRPDGTLAATEDVVYESGQLISYELKELQSGNQGSAMVKTDPKNTKGRQLIFQYSVGGKTSSDSEKLQPDTLINDTVGPFIRQHWDALANGSTVKFRMVALARKETVGFKLIKESETSVKGKPVAIIRMEAASMFIAPFVDPLRFTVEKEGAHRVLNYSGRTTPLIQRKGEWQDLDAFTVFDWE